MMTMPSTERGLKFASALAIKDAGAAALEAAAAQALSELGEAPDLALVFLSSRFASNADQMASQACDLLGTERVLGCTGESIVGTGREIEDQPAVSVWLARWPNVSVVPFHLEFERTREGGVFEGWPEELAGQWPSSSFLLLLAEPFSFPADYQLERLNEDRPGVPVIGGMASGGGAPGENRLLFGRQTFAEGAVGVHISGSIRLRTVVSQGCRPIGQTFVVTRADRNVIYELGGKPALAQLRHVFEALPTREQVLVQRGLHVGRAMSEYRDRFEQGDFLVQNVIGIDPQAGAIAIGGYVRAGQTVQFHVRDHESADAELAQILAAVKRAAGAAPAAGLLFTCNGRGTRLFRQPHHDAGLVAKTLGGIPLAGFFAQGEIGPVGGQNFIHGFTASLALFEPMPEEAACR
jgi:small ligand-binding sensory domain FIST